jgi:hypothetical protein
VKLKLTTKFILHATLDDVIETLVMAALVALAVMVLVLELAEGFFDEE